MEMEIVMGLCDKHTEKARLKDIFDGEAFDDIARQLRNAGRPAPSKKRLAIRWVPFVN